MRSSVPSRSRDRSSCSTAQPAAAAPTVRDRHHLTPTVAPRRARCGRTPQESTPRRSAPAGQHQPASRSRTPAGVVATCGSGHRHDRQRLAPRRASPRTRASARRSRHDAGPARPGGYSSGEASANDFSGNDDTIANPRATATSRASTHDFNRRNSPTAASSTSRSAQPASTAATRPTNSCTSTNSIHPL